MSETETLINTLIQNGLASSRSEAQRMANEIIGTSDKVNAGMREKKDNFMVKDYKSDAPAPAIEQPISPKEQKIEEFRQSAINPQPTHVQTAFDTPANDQKTDFAAELPKAEPTVEIQHSNEVPQMTPEEYAARQMTALGATTATDLTAEPKPVEISTSQLEEGLEPQEPVKSLWDEPMKEAPSDFISAQPAQEAQQPVQAAPQPVEQPQAAPIEQAPEPAQEVPQPEKKKVGFTEEEQKLADDVDLSKVFNFSNR